MALYARSVSLTMRSFERQEHLPHVRDPISRGQEPGRSHARHRPDLDPERCRFAGRAAHLGARARPLRHLGRRAAPRPPPRDRPPFTFAALTPALIAAFQGGRTVNTPVVAPALALQARGELVQDLFCDQVEHLHSVHDRERKRRAIRRDHRLAGRGHRVRRAPCPRVRRCRTRAAPEARSSRRVTMNHLENCVTSC
jgi:hypothetical protein